MIDQPSIRPDMPEQPDPLQRALGVGAPSPDTDEPADRLLVDRDPEVRSAAARRCADPALLVTALETESDPAVRIVLLSALGNIISHTTDVARAAALLQTEHCTDAIRCEVARLSKDAERRRIAVASIRDEDALIHLALHAADLETKEAAAARLRTESRFRKLIEAPARPDQPVVRQESSAERASLYVPRILQQHLVDDPDHRCWTAEGTAALVDISGFTTLSERLARKGREGAEQITEAIGTSFESILLVAYENGGSLLKFGGDAMLLWFEGEGHATRACRATILMRRVLRDTGRVEVPGAKVSLRMSQGVHSGHFHFFAAGDSHVELLPVGPAWSQLVVMEHNAEGGEILMSPDTAARLPGRCAAERKGPGVLLAREPSAHKKLPLIARPKMAAETLAHCLSPSIRAHVLGGGGTSEHRPVTIAFIRFEGTDALIEQRGATAAAEALHRLLGVIATAAEVQQVTFLASDVDADGGKLILTAGAPRVIGDDEGRMLLALRKIVESDLPIPIRIGVHRGAVFAGDIGPFYRRTYTVMGDAVNLAARLMGHAKPGQIYATADVLDRSDTLFETIELETFLVKGRTQPVRAWSVGRAKGSRARHAALQQLPLIGREVELRVMRDALASSRAGAGRLIDIVGESGLGKTRLLEALRDDAADFRQMHGVCEAYTASNPYAIWSELLREFMDFGRDDSDAAILERLRGEVASRAPELLPWLPLIAIAFELQAPPTPEVELLAEKNRRPKLHEVVGQFLHALTPGPSLIQIENAHHMDVASAELLAYLTSELGDRPWLFGIARRPSSSGFTAPVAPTVVRIDLTPLSPKDALRMTHVQAEQHPLPLHVLEAVAGRSGGNPQFLRDLLRAAIDSGGAGGLPDSAEAAAMARIDALAPEDRALVRRAAVFGLTFHPRMLSWFSEETDGAAPGGAAWSRVEELFDEEPDGYLRFRRSLLRDAAYEGLPYKLRRKLHAAVAAHLEEEMDQPEEAAGILSLHYLEAGEYPLAWRYAAAAAKRAQAVYAYVEAAGLYSRALEAGRRLPEIEPAELAALYEAQADSWYRAAEFDKAADGYTAACKLLTGDPLAQARLLLNRSRVEERRGKYPQALRCAALSRKAIEGINGIEAARLAAQVSAWYAAVLQVEGRTEAAVRWAERTVGEAEAADDPEALGAAYFVIGWARFMLGKEGAEALWQRSLDAYRRSGNLVRQAGLLSNLGVASQAEGRWDEAVAYYERGREESLKLGDTINAAVARINVAEILIDRGELAHAEEALLETLPLWKASKYRYYLGACLSLLGRTSARAGRFDQALKRLEESKSNFASVGAEQEVPAVDAQIVECRILMGDIQGGLELARAMLAKVGSNGAAKLVPLLQRVRGLALAQLGQFGAAREAFQASLVAARSQHSLFEIFLTLRSLIELDRLQGIESAPDVVNESDSLLASLKIRVLPAPPVRAGGSINALAAAG